MARFWKLLLMMVTLIMIDQFSKGAVQSTMALHDSIPVIDGFFSITYVRNPGAAFGFLADGHEWVRKFMFLLLPVIFCGWIFVLLCKTLKGPFYLSLAYALILAGAVGNLIDRFSLGYVVDFLDFYANGFHFWTFNVADSCITVAAVLLIWDFIVQLKEKKQQKTDAPHSP